MLTLLKLLVLVAICSWVAISAWIYFQQDKLIFHGTRDFNGDPAEQGIAFDDVTLTTDDGERLHAWYLPHSEAKFTVLFFHGNGGNISDRPITMRRLHELKFNVLVVDYRGYGRSTGRASEHGTYRDATAAWQYLVGERATAPQDIVIYGRSLGGAVALELATRTTPRALIIESTFTSMADMARANYPLLPTGYLLRHEYPSLQRIKTLAVPVLVAHSPADQTIPYSHGEALFQAAPEPREFYRLHGSHIEAYDLAGEDYDRAIARFVSRAAAPSH